MQSKHSVHLKRANTGYKVNANTADRYCCFMYIAHVIRSYAWLRVCAIYIEIQSFESCRLVVCFIAQTNTKNVWYRCLCRCQNFFLFFFFLWIFMYWKQFAMSTHIHIVILAVNDTAFTSFTHLHHTPRIHIDDGHSTIDADKNTHERTVYAGVDSAYDRTACLKQLSSER